MNKENLGSVVFIIVIMLSAQQVGALAIVRFPSSSRLQPIPVYVHPNVVGNVDSSSSVSNDTAISPDQGQTDTANPVAQSPSADQQQSGGTYVPWIFGGVCILLILLFLFFLRKF